MMDSHWSHLLSTGDPAVVSSHQPGATFPSKSQYPPSSRVVGAPTSSFSFDPAGVRSRTLLEGLSTESRDHSMGVRSRVPTQDMSRLSSEAPKEIFPEESSEPSTQAIPRRNLTEAFEELYLEPESEQAATPVLKHLDVEASQKMASAISPSGVAELSSNLSTTVSTPQDEGMSGDRFDSRTEPSDAHNDESKLPSFYLHPALKRELSQPLVNRVSFYGVIHDINKEANSMASHDASLFARTCSEDVDDEEFSPLVVTVNGESFRSNTSARDSSVDMALIDEEKWLLSAIDMRGPDETRALASCPPTFLQAMGEREYENPLSSMETTRTQLWKPSRSWWEAKSGKNPWIEPKSHNKRWRYLWPLIHYHKFLAKCIKKLKRNGVDVKSSVSPVAVFLREEVCAVSDHLASVSLFSSEEWMICLSYFVGWTDPDPSAEARIRLMISKLKLRTLSEPGDVDSPLLRSQIDEQFLRTMASTREQMTQGGIQQERKNLSKNGGVIQSTNNDKPKGKQTQNSHGNIPLHPQTLQAPMYSMQRSTMPAPYAMLQHGAHSPAGSMHPRSGNGPTDTHSWGYPGHGGHWWGGSWPQYAYCDETSVQSGLSADTGSYPQQTYPQQMPEYGMYQGANGSAYYPSQETTEYYYGQNGAYPHHVGNQMQDPYHSDQANVGWMAHPMGDASMAFPPTSQHMSDSSSYGPQPGTPIGPPSPHRMHNVFLNSPAHGTVPSHGESMAPDRSPYNQHAIPPSPFWGHLDQATLAMTGIMTPQGKSHPETPQRDPGLKETAQNEGAIDRNDYSEQREDETKPQSELVINAQPLLINPASQYYHHYGSFGAREGYAPPSPATQFMMSPQANAQAAAYFAHNYGSQYAFSPRRPGTRRKSRDTRTSFRGEGEVSGGTGEKNRSGNPVPSEKRCTDLTPPPTVRKVTEVSRERSSPSTVATMDESESIAEGT